MIVHGLVTVRPGAARAVAPPPPSAPRVADGGELRWQTRMRPSASAMVAEVAVTGLLVITAAVTTWWLLFLILPIAIVIIAASRFTTTADATGLTVTVGPARILHVPIDELAEADVTEVDPFWEFGGWGLRVDLSGRTGVVSRKGEALRLRRGNDSEVLVTVDNAANAAAVLNSAAERASS